jgi:pentose-5-phosphate-3-epimerase
MFGSYADALIPGLHVVEGGQTSTGSAVAWLRNRVLSASAAAAAAAAGAPPPPPPLSYADLDAQASLLPPGSDGLLALDHFQGNRTPHTDPLSRGALVGLTLAHTPAHLHRALVEAVCFGTRDVLEAMRAAGFSPRTLTVAGGATRSPLWLQMHSDIAGLPLAVPRGAGDAPALGCAVLASAAAGFHKGDVVLAASKMVQVDRSLTPDAGRALEYGPVFRRWQRLYPALRPTFHEGAAAGGAAPPSTSCIVDSLPLVAAARMAQVAIAPSLLAADLADVAGDLARLEEGWPDDGGGGGGNGGGGNGGGGNGGGGNGGGGNGGGGTGGGDKTKRDNVADAEAFPLLSSGRRWLHYDSFDGSLGSQITFGAPLLAKLRGRTRRLVDVHLIARDPAQHLEALKQSGADLVTVQLENVVVVVGEEEREEDEKKQWAALAQLLARVRAVFGSAGVAVALGTPAETLRPLLLPAGGGPALVDRVLVMAVPLGYGGQKFQQQETLAKIAALRAMADEAEAAGAAAASAAAASPSPSQSIIIAVDGGIGAAEAALCAQAGADVLVAGSSVFRAKDGASPGEAERAVLRAAVEGWGRRSGRRGRQAQAERAVASGAR